MAISTSNQIQIRAGGTRWRENARLIYEYLRREMRDAEEQRKLRYEKTWDKQVQRTVPLIWRMARELATLYLRPPQRTWTMPDGTDAPGEVVGAIEAEYKAAKVNRRLRTAQEHRAALQNATVLVWLTSDGYRLLTPPIHDQWAWSSRVDAQEVSDVAEWRVRMPVVTSWDATTAATATALLTPTRAIWESGPEGWAGTGIWEADGRNPFGRIPIVYLRGADPAPGEFFVPVPEDLLDAQRAVNHDFTDRGTIARKQGYAQGYIKGLSQSQVAEIEVGPENFVGLPDPNAELGYASPQSSLKEYGDDTDSFVKLVIACSGMSPATVMKSTGITALAKIVENIDREVERQRDKDEFASGEQDLYDLIQKAREIRSGGLPLLPRGVRVRVEHREPVMPADPHNDAQANSQRVALAVDCAASIIAREKAISLDEAQEIAKRNLRLERELAASVGGWTKASEAPSDGNRDAAPTADDVAKTALNGAQVTALQGMVAEVVARRMPPAAAFEAITLAFPDFDPAAVQRMLAAADGFAVPQPIVKTPDEVPT